MNDNDFIYEYWNNLNDTSLLSDSIDIGKCDTFDGGKALDQSDTYNRWNFIETETSKIKNIAYFFDHLYENNIIRQYNKDRFMQLQNLTFIADEPHLYDDMFYLYKEGYDSNITIYDEGLEQETVEQLYSILINYKGENKGMQGYYNCGYLFSVNCLMNQYWQINDNDEDEVFYVLKYMVHAPSMNMLGEYDASVEFHNRVVVQLCRKLTEESGVPVYPSFVEYNIGNAYIDTDKYITIINNV